MTRNVLIYLMQYWDHWARNHGCEKNKKKLYSCKYKDEKRKMLGSLTTFCSHIHSQSTLPADAMPAARPSASRRPIITKRNFGIASISLVTIPIRCRMNNIAK